MIRKNTFLTLTFLLLSSCGSDGDSTSGTGNTGGGAVQGKDFTGTYRRMFIECYSSAFDDLTAFATFTSSSPTETIGLNGNSFELSSAYSSCSYRSSGRMVFSEESSSGGASSGTLQKTTNSVSVSQVGSCTRTWTWNLSTSPETSGVIMPSSISETVTSSTTPETRSMTYLYDPNGYILIFSSLQVVGRPTDLCFIAYKRL
jgi:hypothetical protein